MALHAAKQCEAMDAQLDLRCLDQASKQNEQDEQDEQTAPPRPKPGSARRLVELFPQQLVPSSFFNKDVNCIPGGCALHALSPYGGGPPGPGTDAMP